MYTKKELDKIRKALPKGGFQLIADKMPDTTADAVRMVLMYPDRYRVEVFDALILVMQEYKERVSSQKKKVMEAVK